MSVGVVSGEAEVAQLSVERYMRIFFFFQAEDGIRDVAVTGVQTCALPICTPSPSCCSCSQAHPFTQACARPSFCRPCSPCMRRPGPMRSGSPRVSQPANPRSEEHTSELQSRLHLVCRLLLEKKKKNILQLSSDTQSCSPFARRSIL